MPLSPDEEANIEVDSPDQQIQSELAYLDNQMLSPDEEESIVIDPDFHDALDSTPHPSEVTSPSQVEPGGTQQVSTKRDVAVGYSGIPFAGKGYEEFKRTDTRLAAREQTATEEVTRDYGALGEAQGQKADVEAEHYRDMSKLYEEKQNFLRESADLEKTMYVQAKAERQQYLDSYQQQLAAVRQMSVKSPLGFLSPSQTFAVGGAAFAQGFLAAQGININPIGQIDRWIERDMEEQRQRIGQAERGAQDQLNLYQIARETSRDDLEANQRYRGMMLEQFSVAVEAQAARFGSRLATSNANIAKAQLAIERDNTVRAIGDNYEKARLDNMKAMRETMHQRTMEGFAAQELALKRKAAEAKEGPKLEGITDPEKPTGYIPVRKPIVGADGKPVVINGQQMFQYDVEAAADNRWFYDKDDKTLKKYVLDSRDLWAKRMDKAEEVTKLYDAAKDDFDKSKAKFAGLSAEKQWDMAARFSPNIRRFLTARTNLLNAMIYDASGKAINESEFKRHSSVIPLDKIFQEGNTGELLLDAREVARKNFEREMQAPGIHDKLQGQPASPKAAAMYQIYDQGEASSDPVDKLSGRVLAKDTEDRTLTVSKLYEGTDERAKKIGQPEWASNIDKLVLAAVAPEAFKGVAGAGGLGAASPDLQPKAIERLQFFANNVPGKPGKYAKNALELLKTNPAKAKKLVMERFEAPGLGPAEMVEEKSPDTVNPLSSEGLSRLKQAGALGVLTPLLPD